MVGEQTAEKSRAFDWIEAEADALSSLSDEIWGYAEPALREYESARAHVRFLEDNGFDVEHGVSGMPTAYIATYGSGSPVVGLFAEYDATPGVSQKPVPHEETVVPHAAGYQDMHNGLGVGSVGAACAIKSAMEEHDIDGTIKLLGTPAEKLCIGKPFIARDGHLDDLDAAVAWHPSPHNTVARDNAPAPYRAVVVDFDGVAVYGGRPWEGVSALDATTLMQNNVNVMKEHLPRDKHPSVNELVTRGGQAPTTLPEHSQIWYVFRATDLDTVERIEDVLRRSAAAAADVTGADYDFRVVAATRPWLPNHTMTDVAFANMELVGPPTFDEECNEFGREIQQNLGYEPRDKPFDEELTPPEEEITREQYKATADDVTEFAWHAPTCRIYSAYMFKDRYDREYPAWSTAALAKTGVAHTALLQAAKVMAGTSLDLLTDPETVAEAQSEFENRTADDHIPPLLPSEVEPPTEDTFPPYYPEGWSPPTNIG
jgi:aminobenzoyl-glutamate utilization protein B